ncbi:MAG: hypothetical protein U0T82_17290 [Bacteroidales bacterium]
MIARKAGFHPLTNDTLTEYSGQFSFPAGMLNLGDSIAYRIVAIDAAAAKI